MSRFSRRLTVPLLFALVPGIACTADKPSAPKTKISDPGSPPRSAFKVGAIFDLSGATADVGIPFSEGVRDFVGYTNANGGLDGQKLELRWQDFGSKVLQAEQLYEQYVSQGAKAFLGWGADATEALRPRVNADKVPYMSASLAETLADPKVTPYNFFPAPSYSQQVRIALHHIAEQNKGKGRVEVAVFHQDTPFGTSPLDDGRKYIADRKLDIGFKSYRMPHTATDYIAQIGQAKAQGARYFIIQNVAKPAAKLVGDLAGQKSTAQVICLNSCADELFVKLAGSASEKVIGIMPFAPPVAGATGLATIDNFLKSKDSTAAAKGLHYVAGWYTMATMAEGIANALKGNPDPTGEQVKAGLEKISNFETGVSTPITFTTDSHAGMRTAALYQVQGGAFKKIRDPVDPSK